MHPRDAEQFDWTHDEDEAELAAHHIRPPEVEEVYLGVHVWAKDKKWEAAEWLLVGRTRGGRALTIAIRTDDVFRTIRAITGWDTTRGEITRFLSKRVGEPR